MEDSRNTKWDIGIEQFFNSRLYCLFGFLVSGSLGMGEKLNDYRRVGNMEICQKEVEYFLVS